MSRIVVDGMHDLYAEIRAAMRPGICLRCYRRVEGAWCYSCTTELTGEGGGMIPFGHEDLSARPAKPPRPSIRAPFRRMLVRRILNEYAKRNP